MTLVLFKIFSMMIILGTSLLTGWVPLYAKLQKRYLSSIELGEALAGGVFLGTALFHMLPSAEAGFHHLFGEPAYPYANLFCALGFVMLLFLERVATHLTEDSPTVKSNTIAYVLAVVLSVHALIEGMALGINTNFATDLVIFIAIIVHKGTESFALASSLHKSHLPHQRMLTTFVLFALMTPFGILVGAWFSTLLTTDTGKLLEAIFNACAAGTFLYIATLHQINHQRTYTKADYLKEFLALAVGLSTMAIVAIWV